MRYLCLVYLDDNSLEALSASARSALLESCLDYRDWLRGSGQLVLDEALQSVHSATTLRVRDGDVSLRDGPCVDSYEQLTAFYLLEARDLNAALQLAARIPSAQLGGVEVRAVRQRGPP